MKDDFYGKYSHVKVYLSDILSQLQEDLDAHVNLVTNADARATGEELRHQIGVVQGLKRAINKLELQFGAEPVNEEVLDRRF